MSNKKNSELKNRMSALKVGEPFRLPKSGPTFTSPSARTSQVEAPQNGVPPFELAQSELAQIDEAKSKATPSEAPHIELSRLENATGLATLAARGDSKQSQIEGSRTEAPQNEVPQSESPDHRNAYNGPSRIELTQNELPQNEKARNESPQIELAHAEVARSKPTRNELTRNKVTQSESPQKKSPRNELPQFEGVTFEATQSEGTRIEEPQNGAPRSGAANVPSSPLRFESRIEDAHSEEPHFEPPRNAHKDASRSDKTAPSGSGFFRLSPRAFTQTVLQELPGDSFRLFLWLSSRAWRFVKSDGTVRASVSYIEQDTGMGHATISRGLKTLREKKLISLLDTDYKKGNVWQISPIAFAGRTPEDAPPPFEPPRKEGAQNEIQAASKRDRLSLKMRDEVPQSEAEIRSIKNSKNLSQESIESLLEKIATIRAPEKKRSEGEGLSRLLETYNGEEISMALAYVEKRGTLSGQICHSPFRYLTTAMDDVLRTCQQKGITFVRKNDPIQPSGSSNNREEMQQDEAKKQAAFAAFESELTPAERSVFISEFIAKEFTWGYKPSEPLVTRLAAIAWFDEQGGQISQ